MSSLFSDPGWRRGGTLLGGETIEVDADGNPVAGRDLLGQVKIFQDQNPETGAIKSNRLVYCVAARYTGSSSLTSADAGKLYALDATNENSPLGEFKVEADTGNVADGQAVGVLDEYIGEGVTVRTNDIVWLVVKGPATVAKKAGTLLANGVVAFTQANGSDSGKVLTSVSNSIKVGQVIKAAADVDTTVRVNVVSDHV